jgi:hypothetical protein
VAKVETAGRRSADCNPATVCEASRRSKGLSLAMMGFVAHVRDNGAAAQSASRNVGRLPDEDFCADLDAVVEVDHVGVIETKASR